MAEYRVEVTHSAYRDLGRLSADVGRPSSDGDKRTDVQSEAKTVQNPEWE